MSKGGIARLARRKTHRTLMTALSPRLAVYFGIRDLCIGGLDTSIAALLSRQYSEPMSRTETLDESAVSTDR